MMNHVYRDLIGRNVLVYIDDVIIYSETFEQHLQDLYEVFNTIQSSGLRLNAKKCFFGKHQVKYLGYIISAQGTHADPRKVEKVKNYLTPTSAKETLSFLMLASYYQ